MQYRLLKVCLKDLHFISIKPKIIVFTVTCLEKNGSVGRDFLFFLFFCTTPTTEMHILAVIMLLQHKFCAYTGKRKLKLLITL